MPPAGSLLLAILVAYACALAAPFLRSRLWGRAGAIAGWSIVPVLLLCPLLIPAANPGLRAASAFLSGDLAFKVAEYLRHDRRAGRRIPYRDYCRFLIPFPVLAVVYPCHKRRLTRPERPWPQLVRLLGGTAGFVVAVLTIMLLSKLALIRSSFALSHAVMLVAFVIAIESLSRAACGVERLLGFDTIPIIRNIYLSRTVSEFWRRYNSRVHDWLYRNVFGPTGGHRAPARSLLLVFLISGVFHEFAFAVATSQLTGYQLAFFTIQAPATLASGHLERLARRHGPLGKVVAHAVTILFLGVTSVLFFHGVAKVFPFIYAQPSPLP